MSEAEDQLKQQEVELSALQTTISDLRGALMFAVGDSRIVLATALRNASGKLGSVESKVKELQVERAVEVRQSETAALLMAQQETRLDPHEQQTFAGFLHKDCFKMADFNSLEKFYSSAWERLSECGKDEMSHRVWEGVRRDEYKFSELPAIVREMEAKRAYARFTRAAPVADVSAIPEKDRNDFIHAYESSSRREAEEILERPSFKEYMFRSSEDARREPVQARADDKSGFEECRW